MKHIAPIVLIAFVMSCGSRKQAVANTPKEASEINITKDTITKDVQTIKETVVVSGSINAENEAIRPPEKQENLEASLYIFNHSSWNNLLQQLVSETGDVDYNGFKQQRSTLSNYISSLSDHIPNGASSRAYTLAYWINAYNAMTIDLILRHYPIQSIKDIEKPWDQRHWKLGEKWYNLNEIEHQILRKMDEPRIHFAIVCASFSCPKLVNSAYTTDNLELELTRATEDFLSDTSKNNITENQLELSKIFQWFAKDFKQDGSLIDFLNQYSKIKISEKAKKRFKPYNWDLNE